MTTVKRLSVNSVASAASSLVSYQDGSSRHDMVSSSQSSSSKKKKHQLRKGATSATMYSVSDFVMTGLKFDRKTLIRSANTYDEDIHRHFGVSIFPQALATAIPCGMVAAILKFCMMMRWLDFEGDNAPIRDVSAWSAFSFFVGFLIVFRTSQAYTRFWEGCTASHAMRAEWWDACAAIIAFSKYSREDHFKVKAFQHMTVRLFSLLHAVALAEMEDRGTDSSLEDIEAFSFETVDAQGLDKESLAALMKCDFKIEMIYSWIECLLVEHLDGVLNIPAPLLTRVFQELSTGMVHFHGATKLSCIPFPYPYIQACDWLLIIHWVFCPLLVCQWVHHWAWAFAFTFIQVFILWALAYIAKQIENPFGTDSTDLDRRQMQVDMNGALMTLISDAAMRAPKESSDAELTCSTPMFAACPAPRMSLANTWGRLSQAPGRASQAQGRGSQLPAPQCPMQTAVREETQSAVSSLQAPRASGSEGLFAIPDDSMSLGVIPAFDPGAGLDSAASSVQGPSRQTTPSSEARAVEPGQVAAGRGPSIINRISNFSAARSSFFGGRLSVTSGASRLNKEDVSLPNSQMRGNSVSLT